MKQVEIADLKAHLKEHLRDVRRGETVTVLDRDRPVAQIVPYGSARPARIPKPMPGVRRLGEIPLPPPLRGRGDIVRLLLEDRASAR